MKGKTGWAQSGGRYRAAGCQTELQEPAENSPESAKNDTLILRAELFFKPKDASRPKMQNLAFGAATVCVSFRYNSDNNGPRSAGWCRRAARCWEERRKRFGGRSRRTLAKQGIINQTKTPGGGSTRHRHWRQPRTGSRSRQVVPSGCCLRQEMSQKRKQAETPSPPGLAANGEDPARHKGEVGRQPSCQAALSSVAS